MRALWLLAPRVSRSAKLSLLLVTAVACGDDPQATPAPSGSQPIPGQTAPVSASAPAQPVPTEAPAVSASTDVPEPPTSGSAPPARRRPQPAPLWR